MTPARAKTATLPIVSEQEARTGAALTGNVREGVLDGIRVQILEIDVEVAGRFAFYGDLCDADGESIGHVEGARDLAAGLVEVSLPMILTESEAACVVEGLRMIRRR